MKSQRTIFAALLILLFLGAFRIPTSNPQASPKKEFRATILPVIPFAQICDNAMYIQDVTIPDGTPLKPGTAFIKKWAVQNTGTCGWNKRYSLQFQKGDIMSGETIYLTKWIAAGKTAVLSVDMIAPTEEGKHAGYWMMQNSNGASFGPPFSVKIVVKKKIP